MEAKEPGKSAKDSKTKKNGKGWLSLLLLKF